MKKAKNELLDYLLKNLSDSPLLDRLLGSLQNQGQLALKPIPIDDRRNRR